MRTYINISTNDFHTQKTLHPDDYRRRQVPYADIFNKPLPLFPLPPDQQKKEIATKEELNNTGNGGVNDGLNDREKNTQINQASIGHLNNCTDDLQDKKLDEILGFSDCGSGSGAVKYYPLLEWEMIAGVMHVYEADKRKSESDTDTENETIGETETEEGSRIGGEVSCEAEASVPSLGSTTDEALQVNAERKSRSAVIASLFPVLSFDEFVRDFNYVSTSKNICTFSPYCDTTS